MTVTIDKPAQIRAGTPLLAAHDLRVVFDSERGPVHAVRGVDLELAVGEMLGVVGESGSGKSTTALALARMLPPAGRIVGGSVLLDGDTDLVTASEAALVGVRGRRIGMVFQDPMTSLNPLLTVRRQLHEALRAHGFGDRRAREARAVELAELVGIPGARLSGYPHQFSGGMRQRVMIALALANRPDVLIADEPTTALDPTVQAQILELLDTLRRELGTAVLLITHNMGVVAERCDRVAVMYGGRVIEQGPVAEVLTAPRHPYTAGLLRAVPRLDTPAGTRLAGIPGTPPDLALPVLGCAFADRCAAVIDRCRTEQPDLVPVTDDVRSACWVPPTEAPAHEPGPIRRNAPDPTSPVLEVRGVSKSFRSRRRPAVAALTDVDLVLYPGETLGVVGESGSGKSTLARAIVGIHKPDRGVIRVAGKGRLAREVQMVFQDPFASLNPRMTVGDIVADPLHAQRIGTPLERRARVLELLERVGLDPAAASRLPRDFSGGQRQRIGIARALAPAPSVLICDEAVSALDVSVQAQVVNLLAELQAELGLALLFIAHDLAVVRSISHRIVVLREGRVVETGPADDLVAHPQDPYTKALLAAVPSPVPVAVRAAEAV
ncbi:dipeptide ABC transporter ATP-binding protein [Embleya sp. NPDC020886]|uniref:dipeptide ABC transporter ATP-binding protein n=1 Tax=Embleya sp. NPDC020886 TaxID=3363980 RepID=UPI00378F616C